jgi:hypothetical protein
MSLNLKKLQEIIIEETIKVLNEQEAEMGLRPLAVRRVEKKKKKTETKPATARDVSLASVAMQGYNPNEKQRRANKIVKRFSIINGRIKKGSPLSNNDINFLNTMAAAKGLGIEALSTYMKSQKSLFGGQGPVQLAKRFKKVADQQAADQASLDAFQADRQVAYQDQQVADAESDYDKQLAKLDKYNADKDLETSQQIAQADADYQSVLSKLDAAEKKAKTAGQKKAARRKKVSFLVRKARIQRRLNKKIGMSMEDVQKAVGAKPSKKYDRQTYDAILGLQKKLFPKTPDEHDGSFGPKTLSAMNAKGKTSGKAEKPKASAADLADFKIGNKPIKSLADIRTAQKDQLEVARVRKIGGGRVTPGNNFSGKYDVEDLDNWISNVRKKYGSVKNYYQAWKKTQK